MSEGPNTPHNVFAVGWWSVSPRRELFQQQCYRQHLPGTRPLNYMPPPSGVASKSENKKGKYVLSSSSNNQQCPAQVTLSEHPSFLVHLSAIPTTCSWLSSNQDRTCALHSGSVPLPAQPHVGQKAIEIKWLVSISIHMGHWSQGLFYELEKGKWNGDRVGDRGVCFIYKIKPLFWWKSKFLFLSLCIRLPVVLQEILIKSPGMFKMNFKKS